MNEGAVTMAKKKRGRPPIEDGEKASLLLPGKMRREMEQIKKEMGLQTDAEAQRIIVRAGLDQIRKMLDRSKEN